jgi:hypothetical protein
MPDPAIHMSARRIMMGPVDHAALIVIFIDPEKLDQITDTQRIDPWRQIDIVADEQCLSGRQLENKALMPTPLTIVFEDLDNGSPPFDLNRTAPITKGLLQLLCGGDDLAGRLVEKPVITLLQDDQTEQQQQNQDNPLSHARFSRLCVLRRITSRRSFSGNSAR